MFDEISEVIYNIYRPISGIYVPWYHVHHSDVIISYVTYTKYAC